MLLNRNEIKVGIHNEYNTFDQTRSYTGPAGNRLLVSNTHDPSGANPDLTYIYRFFTLPKGTYPSEFDGNGAPLAMSPYYQEQLVANVKGVNTAYFLQDTVRPIPNLSVDLGVRLENQRLYDFRGA